MLSYTPDSRMREDVKLGAESWFGCGGRADRLFEPSDMEDLRNFMASCTDPVTIIGGLANTIVRDGGIRGITIRLGKKMSGIDVLDDANIRVYCGALNGSVAGAAMKAGIGGLEFLSGIPGSMGGAIAMNAGAYGAEVKDVLVSAVVLLPDGTLKICKPEGLKMSYRHTEMPEGGIVVSAILKGSSQDYDTIKARMTEIKEKRNETQPIREKTGGSTFANPSAEELKKAGLPEGTKAWQVVEMVEGRGLVIGGAQMSEQHCNFMINTGSASAEDLENLGDELIARARKKLKLDLRWEIKRIGERAL